METKKLFLTIIAIVLIGSVSAKDQVKPISAIPDSLSQGAYSVVLDYAVECNVEASCLPYSCSFKKTYAVLNKHGQGDTGFVAYTDAFRSLKGFSGRIYDANGELIQKIKRSDLQSSEYSESLATDAEVHFYECNYGRFPYTIEYEWKIDYRDGVLSFPIFNPISAYNQSLQKASYKLTLPKYMEYNSKCVNVSKPSITMSEEGETVVEWEVENIYAIEDEPYSTELSASIPCIYAEPQEFQYGDYLGYQSSWQDISAWSYTLLEGRNIISEKTISAIKQMTDTIASTRDKVKRVYEYLDETTRYVSIQLGVGGYRPIRSEEVEKSGFGDCKALSLYMRTLLKAIGIESNYVVISTINERLFADYPNVQQSNHVILQVPLKQDTIWLECTNPSIPFGYIHDGIAGHDALPASEEGSGLVRLPSYPDSLHFESYNAAITLKEDGSATGTVVRKSYLSQYEYLSGITDLDKTEQIDFLRKGIHFNIASISNVLVEEDKLELPSITVSYDLAIKYKTIGKDIISIRINPFRSASSPRRGEKREQKIHIQSGFCDTDTIRITIPDNYVLSTSPRIDSLQTKFGSFTSQIAVEDQEIVITQKRLLKQGVYSLEDYDQLVDLLDLTSKKYQNSFLVKRKKSLK